jgi:hypothetical protein
MKRLTEIGFWIVRTMRELGKLYARGEGPEVLGGEVFSTRQETVLRHDKKSRRWLRI